MNQLELHKKIKEVLKKNPEEVKEQEVLELMPKDNFDAKNYFFVNADERWIAWLWDGGFLDITKIQSEDVTRYSCATPEINYIVKVAEKASEFVVDKIILNEKVATYKNEKGSNFRPEFINQILRICTKLPADLLIKVIPKIKEQNWVKLMSSFGQWGFEYEKMFEILYKAGKIDELIDLAEVVLSVKSKAELDKDAFDENPFYIKDFSYTKVFEYLEKTEENNREKVLKLLVGVVRKIAEFGEKNNNEDLAFKINDTFHLYDVDFFEDEYKELEHGSDRNSVKNLMLFTAKIIKDLIEEKYKEGDEDEVKEIFDKYIGSFDNENAKLPDTRAMWQLRLFVLSLCPEIFKDEIRKSLFRLFTVKDYSELISGAEYQRALKESFSVLDENDKRKYVKKVIKYFKKKDQEKENEKENWHKVYGARIFSMIITHLTEEEKRQIKKVGFSPSSSYEPKSSISSSTQIGSIISRSPITQEEFDEKSIEEILELLKIEWTPEKLNKQNESKDFHRPKNADGAGNLLKVGVNNRFNLFIENAEKFFDNGEIDEHYTQAFLRGTHDAIKNGEGVNSNEWQSLLNLMKNLVDAKLENRDRKRGHYDTWLANWQAVYYAMTDVLQELLSEKNKEVAIGNFEKYRDDLLHIFEFLLKYKNDPNPEDEKIESAKSKTSVADGSMVISDPYSMAINSVRGRTFQAFLMFIYQDGKKLEKEEIKIEKSVKDLYEEILKEENTRAMMFMYGHHLPTFYFRNKKWTKEVLIPQIFEEKKDEYLRLASIEGYLTQTLYKEIFEDDDFKKLYEKWVSLGNTKYPNQKHFKDVDEALAIHIALAFTNFDIDIEEDLIKTFWNTDNPNNQARYHEFISFIGSSIIYRDDANVFIKDKKINLKKIEKFWNWALENIDDEKVLSGFGHWINPNSEVLNDSFVAEKIAETLRKSDGDIDWDYGLMQRLIKFAEINPEDTISIIENYFLDKEGGLNKHRGVPMFHIDNEIKEALDIIYRKNKNLRSKIENLINTLIKKGSSIFWSLEDILEK